MTLLRQNIMVHIRRSHARYGRKPIDDVELAHGEWVIKPYWSMPKEHFDPELPDTSTAEEMADNAELPRFLFDMMVEGWLTPWSYQRFAQSAHKKYHARYRENPVLTKPMTYSASLQMR